MEELPYASRLNRLIGQILDGLVAGAPFIVAAIFASMNRFIGIVFMIAAFGWSFFYYFFSDGFSGGQSYGKRALGMHVIDAKSGAPCSFGQSFLRNILLAILGPIDWIFIFGERHQRLGDMAAGTVVITETP
ncbi:MAG TPA: RDD family protein [Gemmatimonadaceae bacterium]|nr:RDD family protein [Gemmatimonadaceae bacterium]